jgi:hypothetical protein
MVFTASAVAESTEEDTVMAMDDNMRATAAAAAVNAVLAASEGKIPAGAIPHLTASAIRVFRAVSPPDDDDDDGRERALKELLNCGAIRDFNWPSNRARKNTKNLLQQWWKMQKGMEFSLSPVTYGELKERFKGRHATVIDAVQQGDPASFQVIRSDDCHHAIVDETGVILGYRYRIPAELLQALIDSTSELPARNIAAGVRGQFPTRHYVVWRDYAKEPFLSAEYRRDLPESEKWRQTNKSLFKYLSNGLRMISPDTYARYIGVTDDLDKIELEAIAGAWFGVAINQGATGTTGVHQDWGDHGYNCVVPWGNYTLGSLVLWNLRIKVDLRPGDAFFFMGKLIAHNVTGIVGERNSIDLFSHKTVLSWKDKEDIKRRGEKLG